MNKIYKKKKENSLIKNIGYNIISQVVALIVPLITAPYIARIFNAELIGEYSYALANSSYFVLIECLGFALYGQIMIASYRDNKEKVSRIFFEIMILKLLLMIISSAAYIYIIVLHAEAEQKVLFLVMLLNIIASGIDVTWFLNGMEEFKVIAIRSVIVRLVNLFGVFALVKNEQNFLIYAIIMQGTNVVANLSVYPNVLKQIDFKYLKNINVYKHIKPAGVYFVPGLINTIFSSSDKTMLGIWAGNYEVGIYEQANKISQICMSAICTIGNVILPRASYLYHNDDTGKKANTLIYNSMSAVQMIAVPSVFGIVAISSEFVPIFFGKGYEKSAIVLSILSVNVLATAMCNLLGQQCLIARERQKDYNIAIVISAVINIAFNFAAIKMEKSIGAARASALASTICLGVILYRSKETIKLKSIISESWKYYVSSIAMYFVILVIRKICYCSIKGIVLHIIMGVIVYFGFLIALREKMMYILYKRILQRVEKNE